LKIYNHERRKVFKQKIVFNYPTNDDCLVGRYNFNSISIMRNKLINALEVIFTSKLAERLSIGIVVAGVAFIVIRVVMSIIERA